VEEELEAQVPSRAALVPSRAALVPLQVTPVLSLVALVPLRVALVPLRVVPAPVQVALSPLATEARQGVPQQVFWPQQPLYAFYTLIVVQLRIELSVFRIALFFVSPSYLYLEQKKK
jgi:hypothetical protein